MARLNRGSEPTARTWSRCAASHAGWPLGSMTLVNLGSASSRYSPAGNSPPEAPGKGKLGSAGDSDMDEAVTVVLSPRSHLPRGDNRRWRDRTFGPPSPSICDRRRVRGGDRPG